MTRTEWRRMMICIKGILALAAFVASFSATSATLATAAPSDPVGGKVPFWLRLGDNRQLDVQARALLAERASVVVLRANPQPPPDDLRTLVERLHSAAPGVPVLRYSWASLSERKKRKHRDPIMGWLSNASELQLRASNGKLMPAFGDVTQAQYRQRMADAIAKAVERAGTDGVAVDLAVRTPTWRPRQLARRCQTEAGFCARYGEGMDALFGQIRTTLGAGLILYNGLWNFGPGGVDDQAKLLRHADAAIVEYFGMNPGQPDHAFSIDILPYLQAMKALPGDKRLFVYGRGSWQYTDYESDYQWQRYLYAAYLLASRANTGFKYHASFQALAHTGRSGGLNTYADWKLPLGSATSDYRLRHGIYSRRFARGLVVVSPDDGKGGSFKLDKPMYSPEGEQRDGTLTLPPGTGLILLDRPPQSPPEGRAVALEPLGEWRAAEWTAAKDGTHYLSLASLDEDSIGEHDLLLDHEKSLDPYPALRVKLRARSAAARLLVVAEVDDPKGLAQQIVLVSRAEGDTAPVAPTASPGYRMTAAARKQGKIPHIGGPVLGPVLQPGKWQELTLDARALDLGGYSFRGWRYARLAGAIDVAAVSLQRGGR